MSGVKAPYKVNKMSDWVKASKLEINKRVAEIEGLNPRIVDGKVSVDSKKVGPFQTSEFYNPCDNWAQAGPLIESYHLSLDIYHCDTDDYGFGENQTLVEVESGGLYFSKHLDLAENVCKAICIVVCLMGTEPRYSV